MVEERAAYRGDIGATDPAELIFLDESGVSTAMTRRHARAPRGERACGSAAGAGSRSWARSASAGWSAR